MDVFGTQPKNETGAYFRCHAGIWGVLWVYCNAAAAEIAGKVKRGYSNDGDGLCANDAEALARVLREHLENGRTAAFEARVTKDFGTGVFDVELVREFVAFLEASGGFAIW
jgi:hypothetical protein